uniref:Outer membrane cytochrome MtrC/MtrF-like domain-containing protein n=1 Tax=Shewanella sp. (strain MR-7) TaxID=60481 RepID=Q0HWT5_SHESR
MRIFTSKKLAYLVALTLTGALVGCGSDGKDGKDGVDGTDGQDGKPGESWSIPAVTSSTVTNVKVINYTLGEGTISYEFEVTNEDGAPVNGLVAVQAKVAALSAKGFINNRTEADKNGVADNVQIGGAVTQATEGAVLTSVGDGHYTFTAPMAGVNTGTEGIVWLKVGGDKTTSIASSAELVVNKPEGAFSTTTEACYSCHVDYAQGNGKHSSHVAQGMNGEVNFVEGCLVCHGSVSKTAMNEQGFSIGGYATNTLSKIGHINHQGFETGFTVMNCSTCHVEAPKNINISGPGCIDCHDTGGVPGDIQPSNGSDVRPMHEKKQSVNANKAIKDSYTVAGTPLALNADGLWCTTMSLYKDGNLVDLHALYVSGQTAYNATTPVNYAGSYLHGTYNKSVIGRIAQNYTESYEADGSKTMCYTGVDLTNWTGAGLMASLRVSFMAENYTGSEQNVITIHGYTDVTDPTTGTVAKYDRRHNVADDSCTTCHNTEANFHKNGNFAEGGIGCIACHNNGQDRRAGGSGPGFGPMIHSMHWGVGAQSTDADGKTTTNAANVIAPQTSCVVCHADGAMDLNAIPNQFVKARAYGTSNKMASPVTANCYACHSQDSAISHMKSMGGTISEDVPATEWYKLTTQESCAVCHNPGSSSGIDKYHNFTRK